MEGRTLNWTTAHGVPRPFLRLTMTSQWPYLLKALLTSRTSCRSVSLIGRLPTNTPASWAWWRCEAKKLSLAAESSLSWAATAAAVVVVVVEKVTTGGAVADRAGASGGDDGGVLAARPVIAAAAVVVVAVASAVVVVTAAAAAVCGGLKKGKAVVEKKRTRDFIYVAALTGADGQCTAIGWRITRNTASPQQPSHYNNASRCLREA